MELGIEGMVTDGPIADRAAISRMQFPTFSRGAVAMTGKTGGWGIEWGGVNVPITVGGITVNPGDMVFGDDDGILIATPEEAAEHLAFVQEKEEWEAWVREKISSGLTISQCRAERPDPMTKVTIGTIRR
jgi:4-hydroxy-4-methyl-2-oxoglutarate aldolase